MRNFWVAIIGVLMIASFAGTSFATAPVVQDIPDFRLLTVSGVVEDFDLNDYVTDYDDDPDDLLWTIEDAGGIAAALGADPSDNLLGVNASATVAQGEMILRATEVNSVSFEYSEDSSVVKYSTLMLVGPGLTQDRNLGLANDAFPRTWVIEADNDITTGDVNALIQPAQAPGAVELSVSIADLDGNILAGDNTATAEFGDLSAAIQSNGTLVLSAPAGAYPLSGMYQLSGAYIVGVKAKLTGGLGEANWDGMELLVSNSRFPTSRDQNTPELLDKFNNFETVSGALPASPAAMRALPSASNPRWTVSGAPTGGATAVIVSTGIPTSTWATSGNALEVNLPAAGTVNVQSELFTDIQPGETLTFAANITTNVTVNENLPDIVMFMGSNQIPSNWCGMTFGQGANTVLADAQVPQNGAWRTIKTTFVADEVGAAIADGAGTVDVYSLGYVAFLSFTGRAGSPGAKVWVDNVRIYRDKSDLDKCLGATKIDVVKNVAPRDSYFDGTFGSATTIAALGWTELATEGAAAIDTTGNNTHGYTDDANALDIYMDNALTRTANQVEVVQVAVDVDATAAGGVDNGGDGIFGATLWFKTNADAPKNAPGVMFAIADLRFMNAPFADVGYAGAPLVDGGWKKVELSSIRHDYAGRFILMAVVRAEDLALRTNWGSYSTDDTKFGADSDAHVYIDDVEFHKAQDSAMYFDRSVFPVVD